MIRPLLALTLILLLGGCDPGHTGYLYLRVAPVNGPTIKTDKEKACQILERIAAKYDFKRTTTVSSDCESGAFLKEYKWNTNPDFYRRAWLRLSEEDNQIVFSITEFVASRQTEFAEDVFNELRSEVVAVFPESAISLKP